MEAKVQDLSINILQNLAYEKYTKENMTTFDDKKEDGAFEENNISLLGESTERVCKMCK